MGLLDRILGREPARGGPPPYTPPVRPEPASGYAGQRTPDERAIERYRYLLATAPPEAVEQAHAEAFAQLTPDQRRQVLQQLAQQVPAGEQHGDDPRSLARMATRAEMRRPGTLERTFGGGRGGPGGFGGGPGFGSMVGGSLLGTVAGVVVGSAIANALFGPAFGDLGSDQFAETGDGGGDGGDAGADDAGGGSDADYSGDYGGGDYGGGDYGGGDYGGGDFGEI